MSNDKHYPLHPNATHPPIMTCEIPLEEYESLKRENAQLKAKLESVQATAYAESVDAVMRERRLQRALWLMGARLGKMGSLAYHNIKAKLYFLDDDEGVKWALKKQKQWDEVERKCRAKAEQYK